MGNPCKIATRHAIRLARNSPSPCRGPVILPGLSVWAAQRRSGWANPSCENAILCRNPRFDCNFRLCYPESTLIMTFPSVARP